MAKARRLNLEKEKDELNSESISEEFGELILIRQQTEDYVFRYLPNSEPPSFNFPANTRRGSVAASTSYIAYMHRQ